MNQNQKLHLSRRATVGAPSKHSPPLSLAHSALSRTTIRVVFFIVRVVVSKQVVSLCKSMSDGLGNLLVHRLRGRACVVVIIVCRHSFNLTCPHRTTTLRYRFLSTPLQRD
jgi:hypothetical protein